jgi:HK97 family phage major capsid protein
MKIKKINQKSNAEILEIMKKNIETKTLVHKQFDVEVKVLEDGKLQAIVNSGQEDRYGEVLDMKGLEIKTYMTNPVLALSHDYSHMSVGRTEKLTKTHEGKLIADFVFATDVDGYETPKILDQLYRKKYQFAFSIGFIPFEMKGNIYTKSQMIEFSPVLIGADSQALLKSIQKELKTKTVPETIRKEIIINSNKKTMKIKRLKLSKVNELLSAQKSEMEATFKAQMDEFKLSIDEVKAKSINLGAEPKDYSKITKEDKLKIFVKGLAENDMSEYRAVIKSAGNTTDDSALLPPTEFVAEVLRLEENYGVARKYCTVRQTDRTSITLTLGDGDVTIYETEEAGRKKSTKASYLPSVMTFKKFAAIAPLTDELLEDAAINIWNDLTSRFARAYAKKEDELIFTAATYGIVNVAGTAPITIDGGSIEDVTFDDINKAIYAVPTGSMTNGRFFFNRTILGVLQRIKDLQGRYILQTGPNGPATGTLWGLPYELTEVLPALSADAEETAFIVFGDLKFATLGERTQLSAKIFDSGIVPDPDDNETEASDLNLLTDDMQAMRVVKRMNGKVVFPAAFAVISTGVDAS